MHLADERQCFAKASALVIFSISPNVDFPQTTPKTKRRPRGVFDKLQLQFYVLICLTYTYVYTCFNLCHCTVYCIFVYLHEDLCLFTHMYVLKHRYVVVYRRMARLPRPSRTLCGVTTDLSTLAHNGQINGGEPRFAG